MNDQEINRAVAESVGFNWWAVEKGGWYYRQGGAGYTNRIDEAGRYTEADARKLLVRGEPMSVRRIPHPDYCNDLNAMHEVEKTLDVDVNINGSPRYVYAGHIYNIVGKDCQPFRATARQRAEAYLRTIGKWRNT
jgi:hypothetical protein